MTLNSLSVKSDYEEEGFERKPAFPPFLTMASTLSNATLIVCENVLLCLQFVTKRGTMELR